MKITCEEAKRFLSVSLVDFRNPETMLKIWAARFHVHGCPDCRQSVPTVASEMDGLAEYLKEVDTEAASLLEEAPKGACAVARLWLELSRLEYYFPKVEGDSRDFIHCILCPKCRPHFRDRVRDIALARGLELFLKDFEREHLGI